MVLLSEFCGDVILWWVFNKVEEGLDGYEVRDFI